MEATQTIRELLLEQLKGKQAHVDFMGAAEGLSPEQAGQKAETIPYTIWQLIEHIRLAQDDILEFCQNPDYEAPAWPEDYWPESHAPESKKELEQSIQAVQKGIEQMRGLVSDPDNDLQAPLPHGDGQTLFREALLIMDHNAYHTGQIVLIRRLLGCW